MQTTYFRLTDDDRSKENEMLLEQAASLLQRGGIVAFPTETVYGLGASIFCNEAILRIYQIKNREKNHPLPVQLAYFEQMFFVAENIPSKAQLLAQAFFPGPLTIIVQKSRHLSPYISGKSPSIGIRISSHPVARRLIELTGCPLVVPSANLTGKVSATMASHVFDDFQGSIEGIVDGGPSLEGVESTIVSFEDPNQIQLLRIGALTKEEIEAVLGTFIERSPALLAGSRERRFQKLQPVVRLFSSFEQVATYLRLSSKSRRLVMGMEPLSEEIEEEYFLFSPKNLYEGLRYGEDCNCSEILMICGEKVQRNPLLFARIKEIAHF